MDGRRPIRVLVVDDERLNREVVAVNLRAARYDIATAEDGQEAWEALAADPDGFDVVVLDRRMPRMDGMQLLAKLKADERLRNIPVIMQTAYASSEDVVEGIKAGVYYYLGKPLDRRLLLSVVASAVEERARWRMLQEELEKRSGYMSLLTRGTFRFRTLEEGNILAVALAKACPRSRFLVVGLSELLTNAVEHGNLGITFDEKARLIAEKGWSAEIERRLADPAFGARMVTVEVERSRHEARITITDEGEGFDWRPYMELEASRAFAAHGRGIAMARRLSFDSLEYRGRGNQVVCVVRDDSAPPAVACSPAAVHGPEDLRLARSMQAELLPTRARLEEMQARYGLKVSGLFETSCDLGGDLWGIEPIDGSRFALWLADFSGHGVGAALNTFRLHTLIRNQSEARGQPAAYLAELNLRLTGLLPTGQYAAMLYGVVDVAEGLFTYAAAAAQHPLAVRLADGGTERGDGSGLPLGITAKAAYAERRLALPPGTLLFLTSDALAENPGRDGSVLGRDGVTRLVADGARRLGAGLTAPALLAPFLAACDRPLRDDLTAVCCLR